MADWYVASGDPVNRSAVSSSEVRAELLAIQNEIADLLPAMTGNGDKFIVVNAGGTALSSLTGSEFLTAIAAMTPTDGNILVFDGATLVAESGATALTSLGAAAASHNHAASEVTSGTLADAQISEASVTQHAAAIAAVREFTAVKSADETLANDNTFNADADLVLTGLAVDTEYAIEASLMFNAASANPGFSWQILLNVASQATQATGVWSGPIDSSGSDSARAAGASDMGSGAGNGAVNGEVGVHIIGYVKTNAGSATNVTVRWAQETSHADLTTLRRGSWIRARAL